MIKKLSLITGVILTMGLFFPSGLGNSAENTSTPSQIGWNLYRNIYDNYDKIMRQQASARASEVLRQNRNVTYTDQDIQDIVAGKLGIILDKHSAGLTQEQLQQEKSDIQNQYAREQEMADYELSLQTEVGTTGIYSNGTLDDSEFDLMVDLNTIDVIYFGEGARVPLASWSTSGGSVGNLFGNKNGNSSSGRGNSNGGGSGNGNGGRGNSNSGGSNTDNNHNSNSGTNGNRNLNGSGDNGNNNGVVCPDPTTLRLTDAALRNDITRELADLQNAVNDIQTHQENGEATPPISSVNDSNGTSGLPKDANGYVQLPPASATANSNTNASLNGNSNGNELPDIGWPCSSAFCIQVTPLKNVATSTVTKQDNSVNGHVSYIYQYLDKITSYPLAQKCTTRQFWGIGTNDINLSDFLHLDVVVSQKPVWSPKRHLYKSDDPAQVREDVLAEIGNATRNAEVTQGNIVQNSCGDIVYNYLFQANQETITANLQSCLNQKAEKENEQSRSNRLVAHLQNALEDTRPLEDEANLMQQIFQNLVDLFQAPEKGILDAAGQLLTKPVTN